MKGTLFLIRIFVFAFVAIFIISCKEKEEDTIYENPENLDMTEFTFIPKSPTSSIETNLVFNGCGYYETSSVEINSKEIEITKHFNSQLKWPCVLKLDTIHLRKLKKGEYSVLLQIIDVNPFVEDSIFFSEIKTLIVTNK